MDKKIKNLLDAEIKRELEALGNHEPGTDEHSNAVATLDRLYKLRIDELKIEEDSLKNYSKLEADKEQNNREAAIKDKELNLKERQIDNECTFRDSDEQSKKEQSRWENVRFWVGTSVQIGLTVGGWIAYSIWYHKGLKFEETGTIGNGMVKNLQSKMFPKK